MADKQPKRPVQKTFSFDKIAPLTQHDNGKGKNIETIYFPVRFTVKTLPKFTFLHPLIRRKYFALFTFALYKKNLFVFVAFWRL